MPSLITPSRQKAQLLFFYLWISIKISIILIFFCLLFSNLCHAESPRRVPAIPNAGVITGRVMEVGVLSSSLLNMKPEQAIYKITVFVESCEDVEGSQNFTKRELGKSLTAYTKENLSLEFFSKRVKAHIRYDGDERGGLYWIWGITLL